MLVEPKLIDFLESKLDVNIYAEIPADHPEMFVTIQRVGSEINDHIEAMTFELCSYAPSKYEALVLDNLVKEAMLGDGVTSYGIVESNDFSACKFGGGSDGPNTATKRYRYRSYYNLFF